MRKVLLVLSFIMFLFFVSSPMIANAEDEEIEEIEDVEKIVKDKIKIVKKIIDEDLPIKIEKKIMKHFAPHFHGIVVYLDLDEETEKKIEELRLKHKEKMIEYRSNLEKKDLELERILLSDKLDTSLLLNKYREISRLKAEMELEKFEHRIRVYNLIPDDKKEDAKEFLFPKHHHCFKYGYIDDLEEFDIDMEIFNEDMKRLKEDLKIMKEDLKEHKRL